MESSVECGHSKGFDTFAKGAASLRVKETENRPRTTAPHGLSHHERDRLIASMHYLRLRGPCVFVSIEAGRSAEAEREVRRLTRRIKSDIAQRQRRAGMRKVVMVTVFEALGRDKTPKFGAHLVVHMPDAAQCDKLISSLNGSAAYGVQVDARRVEEWAGLTTYLMKEATQQARYKQGFRTIGGAIPLGALGGDRVVLSPDLKSTLMNLGSIKPYQRSYAKRAAAKSLAVSEPIRTTPSAPAFQSTESTGNVIVAFFGLKPSIDNSSDTTLAA